MAQVLKNILSFTGLGIGVPASLPHGLNRNTGPATPRLIAANAPGFTITANTINVTVTRTTGGAAVSVYAELWHTYEDAEPYPGLALANFPFVIDANGGGGGASPWERDGAFTPGITSLVNPTDAVVIGPPGFGNAQALHVIKDTQGGEGTGIVEVRGLAVPGSFNVLELADVVTTFATYFKWSTLFAATTEFNIDLSAGGVFDNGALYGCFNTVRTPGGGATLTGLSPDTSMTTGFPLTWIFNKGAGSLTLAHENLGSADINRFQLPGGVSMVIPSMSGVMVTRMQIPALADALRWVVLLR